MRKAAVVLTFLALVAGVTPHAGVTRHHRPSTRTIRRTIQAPGRPRALLTTLLGEDVPTTTTTTVATVPPEPPRIPQEAAPSGTWAATAQCEEGGRNDPTFGYLGIYEGTWQSFGGMAYAPTPSGATWAEQVAVAEAVQSRPPDYYAGGRLVCTGGW